MRYRVVLLLAVVASVVGLAALRRPSAASSAAPSQAVAAREIPAATSFPPRADPDLANPAIDMDGYLRIADEAAAYRERHRVSEAEFLRLAAEPGTIILDARSAEKYAELHVKGAINLSFPDITIESLRRTIPDQGARILIYCNNNFENAENAFPSKMATASLNISTYIALYTYGYRNVYELGPLIDIKASILAFEGAGLAED